MATKITIEEKYLRYSMSKVVLEVLKKSWTRHHRYRVPTLSVPLFFSPRLGPNRTSGHARPTHLSVPNLRILLPCYLGFRDIGAVSGRAPVRENMILPHITVTVSRGEKSFYPNCEIFMRTVTRKDIPYLMHPEYTLYLKSEDT